MAAADTETPVECEIKLAGRPGALRAAEAAIRRAVGGRIQWRTDQLQTVYYDTVDRRLAKRGVAFRVRRKNGKYTQTVKARAAAASAISSRPEWNVELPNSRPDPTLMPVKARGRMGLVLPSELKRLFAVEVSRKSAQVSLAGDAATGPAEVEVAVDRGSVKAGRAKDTISELEIELVSGTPAAIYGLVRELTESGLRVSLISKAERGYTLRDGAPAAAPVRAPKFRMTPEISVSDAIASIFRAGLANVLENEAPTIDGTDPEGVHQMRVSLRRMRSALSVFGKVIDPAGTAPVKDELKWLANSLGPARDWDVFIDEMLAPVGGTGIDAEGVALLRAKAQEEQAASYETARAAIASPRYTRLILALSKFVDTHGWVPTDAGPDHPLFGAVGEIADAILARAYKKLRKRAKGLKTMNLESRHRVRIELKKFRYATDFLQALYPARDVKPFNKALSRMQDQFGHLNDVSVAEGLLGQLTRKGALSAVGKRRLMAASGQVMGWQARGLHDFEGTFLEDWDALKSAPVFWKR